MVPTFDRPAFDAFVRGADLSMLIVTAAAQGERAGCLVGFHTQASIEPPRYLVLLSKANHTYRVVEHTDRLGVHLLDGRARRLAMRFGGETEDDPSVDKFADRRWEPAGSGGPPMLLELDHRFVGRIEARVDCGDHVAMLLEPESVWAPDDGEPAPLRLRDVIGLEPGHEA